MNKYSRASLLQYWARFAGKFRLVSVWTLLIYVYFVVVFSAKIAQIRRRIAFGLVRIIPRLHDQANIEQTSSQLVEPAWSCKRGIEQRLKRVAYRAT